MGLRLAVAAVLALACGSKRSPEPAPVQAPPADAGPARRLVVPTAPDPGVRQPPAWCPNLATCAAESDKGFADACVKAGSLYWRGHRIDKAGPADTVYYGKACDAGNADGCRYLAFKYQDGAGVDADARRAAALSTRAARLYEDACAAGQPGACASLASMVDLGEGVRADPGRATALRGKAAALARKACEGGDGAACAQLGFAYRFAEGVAEDRDQAAEFYGKACDLGLAETCTTLGQFWQGRDDARAASFLLTACALHDPDGCVKLGDMYAKGQGAERDPARALELYQWACELGDWRQACAAAATMQAKGGDVKQDDGRAAMLHEKACEAGNPSSCLAIALLFEAGRGVVADAQQAAEWLARACAAGAKDACDKPRFEAECAGGQAGSCDDVGRILVAAHGGVTDARRAVDLFRRACDAGDERGCEDSRAASLNLEQVSDECDRGSAESCYQLGLAYELSPSPQRETAVEAFRRACTLGVGDACARRDKMGAP